jgi:hypothetical protein
MLNAGFFVLGEKVPRVDLNAVPKHVRVRAGRELVIEVPYECKYINKESLLDLYFTCYL